MHTATQSTPGSRTQSARWHAFVSPATLASVIYALVMWTILAGGQWDAAAAIVLIMYARGAGHRLAAIHLGLPVQDAPVFHTGGSIHMPTAFVPSTPERTVLWYLSGPLCAAIVGIVCLAVGASAHLGAVQGGALAGLLSLLIAMLPSAGKTLKAEGAASFFVLRHMHGHKGVLVNAYAATLLLVLVPLVVNTRSLVRFFGPHIFPAYVSRWAIIAAIIIVLSLTAQLSIKQAVRATCSDRRRYLIFTCIGWLQPPYFRIWIAPVAFLGLVAAITGRHMGPLQRRVAQRRGTGTVAAWAGFIGYDILICKDARAARIWLDDVVLHLEGQPAALQHVRADLAAFGYPDAAPRIPVYLPPQGLWARYLSPHYGDVQG